MKTVTGSTKTPRPDEDPFTVLEGVAESDTSDTTSSSDTSDATSSATEKPPPAIPGLGFLGCGYDVFGRFADPDSVKRRLFDFSGKTVDETLATAQFTAEQVAQALNEVPPQLFYTYRRPENVMCKPRWESDIEYQTTGSMESQQTSMSAQAGLSADLGVFGGELNVRYEQSLSRVATQKYYSVTAIVRYYELTMDGYQSPRLHAKNLPVIAQVRADLDDPSITPEEIFDEYGTHYLWALTVGCSIIYGHTIDTSLVEKSYDAEADLKAKYEGIGVSAGGGTSEATKQERSFEKIKVHRKGLDVGDEATDGGGANEPHTPRPLDVLKSGWHHPVLIDLPGKALKPIWELCLTPERHTALQEAFPGYARGKGYVAAEVQRDLHPMYLLKLTGKGINWSAYRLWPDLRVDEVSPGTWQPVSTKPWLYVFTEQRAGTLPLYEFYCDLPSNYGFRYETSAWLEYLNMFNKRWKLSSATPVGYVYDGLQAKQEGAIEVYAYYPKTAAPHFRCYYSTDSADSRDNGGWRPMQIPSDDGVSDRIGSSIDHPFPDTVRAVLGASSNVHWRTPPLSTT